jgi:hypothetical protein
MVVKKLERLFWSIAFPGFGQLLNRHFFKGIVFIVLEMVVNTNAHFNRVIQLSFNGEMRMAVAAADIDWLMFYPCIYFYSMWDAYKNAGEPVAPLSFLPFVFSAYSVTVGLIYAARDNWISGAIGPVFFPIMCVLPGVGIGLFLKWLLEKITAPSHRDG